MAIIILQFIIDRKKLRGKHSVLGVNLAEETIPTTQYVRTDIPVKSDLNGECTSYDCVDINSSRDPLCMYNILM